MGCPCCEPGSHGSSCLDREAMLRGQIEYLKKRIDGKIDAFPPITRQMFPTKAEDIGFVIVSGLLVYVVLPVMGALIVAVPVVLAYLLFRR